jgi:hypothetical protein
MFASQETGRGGIMLPQFDRIEFERSIIHATKKSRGIPMTVCVAAMCNTNVLIGASDRMLTAGDVEFEPETPKIYSVTNSSVVMIAGEASVQSEILQRLYVTIANRIAENNQEWIPIVDFASEYQNIYQKIKSSRAEARILRPLGLTLDTFIAKQKEMSSSIVADLTKEMVNFEMPAIEAIVSGIDGTGAHIFVVNNSSVTCLDAIGFAAIGAGYWHANSQFMFAGHNRNRPLPETFLLTYAAKRRAEVAPGVGIGTDMFTIGPEPGSFATILAQHIESVDKIYKRTRARAAQSVKKSNLEVTKYVEQIGHAATAQRQETPTPNPTEKTTRTESDGEADFAGRKPN